MRSFDYNGGRWAKYRAHGDIFPLSPGWIHSLAEEAEVDFPRRGLWAAEALNNLALQVSNSKIDACSVEFRPINQPILLRRLRSCTLNLDPDLWGQWYLSIPKLSWREPPPSS